MGHQIKLTDITDTIEEVQFLLCSSASVNEHKTLKIRVNLMNVSEVEFVVTNVLENTSKTFKDINNAIDAYNDI